MDIIRQRLLNQQIARHDLKTAEQMVHWFGAMQAQDYAGAKWAIGLRLNNVTDAKIEQALNDGKILRTHVMRPTWHFVTPEDIRWMLQLTGPRINAGNASRYREFELTEKALNKCQDILIKHLQGDNYLTREEISEIFNKEHIATHDNRGAHIMMHAELAGLICSGPRKGNQTTYALMDERVPKTTAIDRDEALSRLIGRYFKAHGPATVHDCAWWSGLTLGDVKRGIDTLEKDLQSVVIKQQEYWFAADMSAATGLRTATYLLPNYDEYIVGYADRTLLAAASHINSRNNVLFSNTIILKGKVAGAWKRTLKKDSVVIEDELFTKGDKPKEQLLQKAANAYGKFLGKKAILSV